EMFNDPGIDLSTKSILEQMRQMTPRLSAQIGSNSEVDGEFENYCPFLTFPNEVISNILSRLSPKDRLKARVNKRLNAIEADSKYFEKELNIVEEEVICCRSSIEFESDSISSFVRTKMFFASRESSRTEKSRHTRRQ
ncbi:hypothetical protein PMAYCL1PPCAC_01631, partial [Pristionchus mayeri]